MAKRVKWAAGLPVGLGVLAALLGGRAGFAQSALAAPANASAFMHSEFDLMVRAVLWIVLGTASLTVLVLGYLLLHTAIRKGLAGSRFSPESFTAIGWIILPLAILVAVMAPAIELLYQSDEPPYVTVSVTAHEWYWSYDYVSVPGLGFTSHVVPDSQLPPGQAPGSLADHPLVLPAGKKVRFIVSSADVLHGFFVPPLGVEIYAVPGALLNGWTIIKQPGVYFGHSSSICGNDHPPMPIEIKAVPLRDYLAWTRTMTKTAIAAAPGAGDGP